MLTSLAELLSSSSLCSNQWRSFFQVETCDFQLTRVDILVVIIKLRYKILWQRICQEGKANVPLGLLIKSSFEIHVLKVQVQVLHVVAINNPLND